MDETLIYDHTTELNWKTTEWTAAGSFKAAKTAKFSQQGYEVRSLGYGSLFLDYIEKSHRINIDRSLSQRLKEEITKRWSHMKKKKVIFHQNNAASVEYTNYTDIDRIKRSSAKLELILQDNTRTCLCYLWKR